MSQPLIVKAKYEKEIRILPVYTYELSFDELYLMISRLFKGQIAADDDLILKYVDTDGDLITLGDSADLDLALLENKKLCIHVSSRPQKDSEHPSVGEPIEASKNSITSAESISLVDELATVRSQLNNIIDRLASCRPVEAVSTKYKDVGVQEKQQLPISSNPPVVAVPPPSLEVQTLLPPQTSMFTANPTLAYNTQLQQPAPPSPPPTSFAAPVTFNPATQPSFQPTYYTSQPQQQFMSQYGRPYSQASSSFAPPPLSSPPTWMTGNPSQYQMQSAPVAPPPPPPPLQSGFPGQQQHGSAQHHSGSYPRQRGYQ